MAQVLTTQSSCEGPPLGLTFVCRWLDPFPNSRIEFWAQGYPCTLHYRSEHTGLATKGRKINDQEKKKNRIEEHHQKKA